MESSTEHHIIREFTGLISQKHSEFLSVTHNGLITLFRDIGGICNQYSLTADTKSHSAVYHQLSKELTAEYGLYFGKVNLKSMVHFAKEFDDFWTSGRMFPPVSWEHIMVLLQVKEPVARKFYIALAVEQGLAVKELQRQIAVGLFEQSQARLHVTDGNFRGTRKGAVIGVTDLKSAKDGKRKSDGLLMMNFFKKPLSRYFVPIIETVERSPVPLQQVGEANELFSKIAMEINRFGVFQNRWYNLNLNVFFWEIGRKICEEMNLSKDREYSYPAIIKILSSHLVKGFSKTFNESRLVEMVTFARQVQDVAKVALISNLLTWDQIAALSSVENVETKLSYARLTAEQELSLSELEEKITEYGDDWADKAQYSGLKTLATSRAPVVTRRTEKSRNAILEISEVWTDIGEDIPAPKAVSNILQNRHFMNFITAL